MYVVETWHIGQDGQNVLCPTCPSQKVCFLLVSLPSAMRNLLCPCHIPSVLSQGMRDAFMQGGVHWTSHSQNFALHIVSCFLDSVAHGLLQELQCSCESKRFLLFLFEERCHLTLQKVGTNRN